ncbi:unnamed protein product, partial [Brassica oleracea]
LCSSQISNRGRFRVFFRKCLNMGNTRATCYDGLKAATILGLEESIKILEPNVPKHPLSTFAQAIFKVCLGRDKEASQVFQLFAAHHADLRSEEVLDLGRSMQYLMPHFYAPWLNDILHISIVLFIHPSEYLILLCFKTLKNKDMSRCMTERSSPSGV